MPAPVCSPTRSAIITGTMQTTNGFHNHRSSRNKIAPIYLPENVETIPQLFRKGGYNTFNIGKEDYNFIFDRNDLYYESSPKPKRLFYKMEPDEFEKYFVQDNSDKPFFGQVMLLGGKNRGEIENPIDREEVLIPPYYPEDEVIREAVARHYDQARITDREVGDLLELMNTKGFLENTIIFFFSDHGFNTGIRDKQFCYDSGLHVPFIVTQFGGEGKINKGEIRNDLVSGIDIATTSLALAGIDIPNNMEGNNLFAENFEPRDFVISARDRCDYTIDYIRTVRTKRYRYIRNFLTDRAYMQPQYRDKFPFTQTMKRLYKEGKLDVVQSRFMEDYRPAEELYDIENDPHEINNLMNNAEYLEQLNNHRQILNNWMKETDDKGQYPESEKSLKATYERWGDKCVNPEFDKFKKN